MKYKKHYEGYSEGFQTIEGECYVMHYDEMLENARRASTRIDSLVALVKSMRKALDEALKGAHISKAQQAKIDEVLSIDKADIEKMQEALDANVPYVEHDHEMPSTPIVRTEVELAADKVRTDKGWPAYTDYEVWMQRGHQPEDHSVIVRTKEELAIDKLRADAGMPAYTDFDIWERRGHPVPSPFPPVVVPGAVVRTETELEADRVRVVGGLLAYTDEEVLEQRRLAGEPVPVVPLVRTEDEIDVDAEREIQGLPRYTDAEILVQRG